MSGVLTSQGSNGKDLKTRIYVPKRVVGRCCRLGFCVCVEMRASGLKGDWGNSLRASCEPGSGSSSIGCCGGRETAIA